MTNILSEFLQKSEMDPYDNLMWVGPDTSILHTEKGQHHILDTQNPEVLGIPPHSFEGLYSS